VESPAVANDRAGADNGPGAEPAELQNLCGMGLDRRQPAFALRLSIRRQPFVETHFGQQQEIRSGNVDVFCQGFEFGLD